MAIHICREQLEQALKHVKTFTTAADTLKMAAHLDTAIHHPFGQKFFVDKWPDFDIIVATAGSDTTISHKPSFTFATRTESEERLLAILKEVVLPPEMKQLYCEGVPVKHVSVLEKLAKMWSVKYEVLDECLVLLTDHNLLKAQKLHEGYIADSATLDDAELITSQWEYSLGDSTLLMTKYDIENRPSVAIRDKEGNLVAWEVVHYYVSPGMLQVLPEHRGKGLGKYIVSALAKKLLDQGHVTYIHISKSNPRSIHLHQKCGFQILETNDAHWGVFTFANK